MDSGRALVRCIGAVLACSLSACVHVRLQSFDDLVKELTSSLNAELRRDCDRPGRTTDYMECFRQADRMHNLLRQEQQKEKPRPYPMERPTFSEPVPVRPASSAQ